MCANSIQHSRSGDGGQIAVSVIAIPGGIRIEVADQGGPSVPALRPAATWDYARDATGTVTWFELAEWSQPEAQT